MTVMAVGCLLTAIVTMTGDFLFPNARETEVWLGFEVTGTAAMLTAPIHWTFFAVCSWGFFQQKSWVVPVATAYALYAAASHIVWSEVSENGRGWPIGLLQAVAISSVGVMLWRKGRGATRDG